MSVALAWAVLGELSAECEPEEQEHAEKEHGREKDKEKGKKGDD